MTGDTPIGASMQRALQGWGPEMPPWVRVLAEQCDASSQARTAARLRVSGSVVNQALANTYPAALDALAEKVAGAFMAFEVDCPVLGSIGRDRCLHEQAQKYSSANRTRVQLFRACRSGCVHSNIRG